MRQPQGISSDDLANQGLNLMAFADLNNDKYTDIITVSDSKSAFTVHIFEP